MSETPKRRFWQIHLSTIVIATIVAGGFIWIGLQPRLTRYKVSFTPSDPDGPYSHEFSASVGWPLTFWHTNEASISTMYLTVPDQGAFIAALRESALLSVIYDYGFGEYDVRLLVADILIGLSTLALVCYVAERFARRRDPR